MVDIIRFSLYDEVNMLYHVVLLYHVVSVMLISYISQFKLLHQISVSFHTFTACEKANVTS